MRDIQPVHKPQANPDRGKQRPLWVAPRWLTVLACVLALLTCAAAAHADEYRIAPGDLISITVFGEDDLNVNRGRVAANGKISFPLLGEIQVAGFTAKELETHITNLLLAGYLRKPQVTVSILEYRPVYVNGAVNSPGGYGYREGMTVEKAITLAGGFSETANRKEITVARAGGNRAEPAPAKLSDLVDPGDVISVGQKEARNLVFYVQGEVKSPGAYPYQDGLTVQKAVTLAGGFTPRASTRKITIVRDADPDHRPEDASISAVVAPGDIISVGASLF
jgi:protein involved in polysaccharide export with SLBB domain